MNESQSNLAENLSQDFNASYVRISEKLMWTRKEAALMCGVCVSTFSKWVREGFMPQPSKDRMFSAHAIKVRLLGVSVSDSPVSAYDQWKATS